MKEQHNPNREERLKKPLKGLDKVMAFLLKETNPREFQAVAPQVTNEIDPPDSQAAPQVIYEGQQISDSADQDPPLTPFGRLQKQIYKNEHPLFKNPAEVYCERYVKTRTTEPYLRIRDMSGHIETSFIAREDPESGEITIKLEGIYPIDENNRRKM